MKHSLNKPTNPRAQRQHEQRRLFWIVVAFLVMAGSVAIALAYGPRAVTAGLVCLVAGAAAMGLLWLLLTLIERLTCK